MKLTHVWHQVFLGAMLQLSQLCKLQYPPEHAQVPLIRLAGKALLIL